VVPSHKLVTADYEQSSNINSFVNLSFMYYFGKYKLNIIYDDGTARQTRPVANMAWLQTQFQMQSTTARYGQISGVRRGSSM